MKGLINDLAAEMDRQDRKHGSFSASTELGRLRLAIACLEDEVAEVKDAWREERRIEGWPHTEEELLQVAAVALRIVRDLRAGTPGGIATSLTDLIKPRSTWSWLSRLPP